MNIFGDDPNVVFINEDNTQPEELIEQYTEAFRIAESKEGVQELLWEFMYDVQYHVMRQYFIDNAKATLGELEMLDEDRDLMYEEPGEEDLD